MKQEAPTSISLSSSRGDKVNNGSISYKKLKLLEHVNGYLIERRSCFSLMTKVASIQTA